MKVQQKVQQIAILITALAPVTNLQAAAQDLEIKSAGKDQKQPGSISSGNRPCLEARIQLDLLHEPAPLYRAIDGSVRPAHRSDDYQGDRNYLSDDDRDGAIHKARNAVLKHCSDPAAFRTDASSD